MENKNKGLKDISRNAGEEARLSRAGKEDKHVQTWEEENAQK